MHLKHPLDLTSGAFMHDEYAYYAWLRDNAPVYKGKLSPFMSLYLISRYEDVVQVLKDPRFLRNRSAITGKGQRTPIPLPKSLELAANSMILEDEPNHRRLRNLVHKAFTPHTVARLAPRVESLAHELLDKAMREGQVDLLTAYAIPIPVTIIAELVGVAPDERDRFLGWSKELGGSMSLRNAVRWYTSLRHLIRYTRDLIAHRRANPQDDLLSALVHAEDEGSQLNEDELISMVLLLIIAGYETTLNLIANGTRALLAHPDQRALLRAEPERIEAAVEEILRYDSPAQGTKMLYPTEAITLHDVTIPRAATVMPLIGSANRDERVFSEPDRFDITRSPNKNLAFGHGIHYCLGAPLARLEGQVALNVLLARCPDLRLAVLPQEVRYQTRPLWHRLESLPVALA